MFVSQLVPDQRVDTAFASQTSSGDSLAAASDKLFLLWQEDNTQALGCGRGSKGQDVSNVP